MYENYLVQLNLTFLEGFWTSCRKINNLICATRYFSSRIKRVQCRGKWVGGARKEERAYEDILQLRANKPKGIKV